MRNEKWKQVFIETFDGQVLGIQSQLYLTTVSNRAILEVCQKQGWYWIDDYTGIALTNDSLVMRVHPVIRQYECWYDKMWKKFTKNWVHLLK